MFPLVIPETLGLFVNTLTSDEKDSLLNRDNSPQAIQMRLFQKQKLFSQCLGLFLKSTSSFGQFEERDDPHTLCISKSTDCKRCG